MKKTTTTPTAAAKAASPAKATISAIPTLTIAEALQLTAAKAADAYAAQVNIRQRAFVTQGKLVYALDQIKLPKGTSIYGLLQSRGVPEGSVHQAKMTADLIGALVVPNHLTEARLDEVITFRIAKVARQLWQGKGTAIKMEARDLAAIMAEGTSAQVLAELTCHAEHGVTMAVREEQIATAQREADEQAEREKEAARIQAEEKERQEKEQAAEQERLRAELAAAQAERDRLAAEQAAATPAASTTTPDPGEQPAETDPAPSTPETKPGAEPETTTPGDTPNPEEEEEEEQQHQEQDQSNPSDTPDPSEEEEQEQPAPQAATPSISVLPPQGNGNGNGPGNKPTAPTVTLVDITTKIDDTLLEAMALDPEDMTRLSDFLRKQADHIASIADSVKDVEHAEAA